MTEIAMTPSSEAPAPATAPSAAVAPPDAEREVARADAVLNGRNAAAAVCIAGLLAAGQLDTAGTVRKLPMDEFPDDDPEVVQRVWERAMVVGVRAGQLMNAPRFYRDKLERLQGVLTEAGFVAMGRSVGRARAAVPGHPVDSEDEREH